MTDLVPANGQFGPEPFSVFSQKTRTEVRAKFLKDSTGENYVINPTTSKPYIVPLNYDPDKTVVYFSNKLNEALFNPLADGMAPGGPIEAIYPHLYHAF